MSNHEIFNLKDSQFTEQQEAQMTLSERLLMEQKTWRIKITDITEHMKKIQTLVDAQMEMYNSRQMLLEQKHYYMSLMAKVDKKYKASRKNRLDHYYKNSDIKYNKIEIEMLINADTADDKDMIIALEDHIDYLEETVKTIDNQIYGIRHRIDLEAYKRN
jgi:uncharacterized protein YoxC